MGTKARNEKCPFFTLAEHIGYVYGNVAAFQYSMEVKVIHTYGELDMVRNCGAPVFDSYLMASQFSVEHAATAFSKRFRLDGCGLLTQWAVRGG